MDTPEELRQAYLATVVTVEIEAEHWVTIEESVRSLPTPLHIVTPWNPFSVELSEDENHARMSRLVAYLDRTSTKWLHAKGTSPDGSWSEDSVLLVGMSRDQALELGRAYDQHAIFEITKLDLIVLSCAGTWETKRGLKQEF